MTAPILLVHGSCHGAWCWSRLIVALEARKRSVFAIDLPGAGKDVTPLAEITADLYARRVVEALNSLNEPAIVVGHSMGGLPITVAAELAPKRIAKLVYLCAYLPRNGESIMNLADQSKREDVAMEVQPSTDGLSLTISDATIDAAFYADCSDEDVAFAKARLRPQAVAPLTAVVSTTADRFGRIPRVYIECTEDRAIPIAHQRAMAAASAPIEVHTLHSSHSPFFSAPDALADILLKL